MITAATIAPARPTTSHGTRCQNRRQTRSSDACRAYLETHHVNVPWTNKELTVRWERLVSKLEPGQKVLLYNPRLGAPRAPGASGDKGEDKTGGEKDEGKADAAVATTTSANAGTP